MTKHLLAFLILLFVAGNVFAQTCSSTKRCELGCCNSNGVCGYGPDYCGSKCISDCDRKSECNPGFGSKWAERDKCPLNVCCSKFGFCGTTKDFCGSKKVKRPSCSKSNGIPKVIGYYEGWATTQRTCNQFYPEQLPIGIYTHLNFAFATIDPKTFQVLPMAKGDKNQYERLMLLKKKDPDLKIFVAIGGWAFNDPGATRTTFSDLSASVPRQKAFISSLISFMSTYGFDGVDIDWEYPAADDRAGREVDFANFPKFIARLRSALSGSGRSGITVTLPASYWYLQHFDLKALSKDVSWFNLMSYDLHGTWDKGNRWTGNFLNAHTNLTEIADALDLIWRNDIEPKQVVLGLGFYGRSFTASSSSCLTPGCTFESGGQKGRCSGEIGILLNSEIDEIVKKNNIKPKLYEKEAVKVATWGNQWVAYDDEATLKMKSEFAQSQCLGGLMVWAVSHDTEDAKYSKALGKVANRKFTSLPSTDGDGTTSTIDTKYDQCKWTNCGESCPSGWAMVKRTDDGARDNEYMFDESGCDGDGVHKFCCPTDDSIPKCGWYTHNNGNCDEQCPSGTIEIGSNDKYCNKRYQAACCTTDTKSMNLYKKCEWGQYPMCNSATCPWKDSLKSDQIALSSSGSGGATCNMWKASLDGSVWEVQARSMCCDTSKSSESFTDCEWYDNYGPAASGRTQDNFCRSGCPDDRIRVALDTMSQECYQKGGGRARCCVPSYKDSFTVENPLLELYRASVNNFMRAPVCEDQGPFKNRRDLSGSENQTEMIVPRQSQSKFDQKKTVELLIAIFAATSSKPMLEAEKKIWDDGVGKRFENLKIATLGPWLKKLDAYKIDGPITTFNRLVCNMYSWNDRVGGSKSKVVCSYPRVCEYFDNGCDGEDGPLGRKRENGEVNDIGRLDKRAARDYTAHLTDSNGQSYAVTITLPNHPTAGRLDPNDPLYDEAIDFVDEDDCGSTSVAPQVIPHGTDDGNGRFYQVEHPMDANLIRDFMEDAAQGRIPNGQTATNGRVSVSFFRQVRDMPMYNAPPLPGGQNYIRPYDRIMECLGSTSNMENFALAGTDINQIKGRLVRDVRPMSDKNLAGYTETDPEKVLQSLRAALSMIRYLNLDTHADVRQRLANIANDIYAQWKLIENEWNKNHPLDKVNVSDYWKEWIVELYKWLSDNVESFVQNGIDTMMDHWELEESVEAAVILEHLRALEAQLGEKIDTSLFFPPRK